jgi:hypothetical protein
MIRAWIAVVVAALTVVGVRAAGAQTAEQVVDRHIAAIGGRAALTKIRSRTATGTITISTPAGDLTGSIQLINEAPNKSRTFVQLDASSLGVGQIVIDQRFDGVNGYVLDSAQGNREITGNQLDTMRSGSFPEAFLNYRELGATIRLEEKQRVGDREAFVLVYEPTSGSIARHFIDTETYMALKTEVKIDVPQFGEIEQSNSYFDYRDVDGVKLPFRLQSTSNVQNFSVTIAKVEHNLKIDPALFVKPAAK